MIETSSFVSFLKIKENWSESKVTVKTKGSEYQLVSINPHGLNLKVKTQKRCRRFLLRTGRTRSRVLYGKSNQARRVNSTQYYCRLFERWSTGHSNCTQGNFTELAFFDEAVFIVKISCLLFNEKRKSVLAMISTICKI